MYTSVLYLGVDVNLLATVVAAHLGEEKLWNKMEMEILHLTQKVDCV